MNQFDYDERESREHEYEKRLDNEARFREPSDAEIDAELLRRANERGITVADLIERILLK